MQITLSPIGYVNGGRKVIEDDHWGSVESRIDIDPGFSADCLKGLGHFSHALVVFYFDRVLPEKIEISARHPRNNPAWPLVGIFAQRGKNRPNRLGVSTCKIIKVDGLSLFVRGLDALNGTPVLDIKPVFREFQIEDEISQPEWVSEIMRSYWQ